MGPESSDEALMLAFRSGEVRAFEELVRRHRTAIFNFVLRFTGDRTRAEDVLQDTWLKVVRNAAEYEPKARFTTFVFTVARNLCVDAARKERFRQVESLDAPDPAAEGRALSQSVPSSAPSPERDALHRELQPLLIRALASLPDEQREVFVLREYSGVPFKEIAAVTGASENTVKSRMRYALEGLRRALAELGVGPEAMLDDERKVAG